MILRWCWCVYVPACFCAFDQLKGGSSSPRPQQKQKPADPLSRGVASIAFVLPQAPQKRAALCAERGPTPITPVRKERIKMIESLSNAGEEQES